jgi:hypothetical protein
MDTKDRPRRRRNRGERPLVYLVEMSYDMVHGGDFDTRRIADAGRTLEMENPNPEKLRRALAVVEFIAGGMKGQALPSDTVCGWLWGLAGVAHRHRSMLSPEGKAFVYRFTGRP